MNYGMNTPCMVCKQKNDTYLYYQLDSLYRDLRNTIQPVESRERFNWYNNIKCKYGLQCNDLNMYNNKLNRLCEELTPYLVAVAQSNESNRTELLQRCLRVLRGNYPNVYRQLEQMYSRNHMK